MAKLVEPLLIGVDVSKHTLDVCLRAGEPLPSGPIPNTRTAIAQWLETLPPGPVCLAAEATGTFHLQLLEQAHRAGHTVYLIDGYRLNRYRESVGIRAKTDTADARLLLRYLAHERDQLRPWSPPPPAYQRLQRLLGRRAALVQARVAVQQSLAELPELRRASAALLRQFQHLDQLILRHIHRGLAAAGWDAEAHRVQAIEGIGPLNAAALTVTFHRGAFRHADAFIAFLGLDVRVRDSGLSRGRRRLTKKGPPEMRRLLYLAALQACRSPTWRPFYQRHLDRGLAKTQALVILARKLARVAFALLSKQAEYQPKTPWATCSET